jgi:hypothetical protein
MSEDIKLSGYSLFQTENLLIVVCYFHGNSEVLFLWQRTVLSLVTWLLNEAYFQWPLIFIMTSCFCGGLAICIT